MGEEEKVGEGVVYGDTFIGVKNAATAEKRGLPIFGPNPAAPRSSLSPSKKPSFFFCRAFFKRPVFVVFCP